MLSVEAFRPFSGDSTTSVAAGTASGSVFIGTASLPGNISVRVHNNSTGNTAFWTFSTTSTLTATTTGSIPVPPGAIEVYNIDQAAYVAAITGSGTASVYFTKGYGL